MGIRADIGMLFQENALFDSLTVAENVGYRLYEETDTPEDQVRRRIEEVLGFIGLEDTSTRCPRPVRRPAAARGDRPRDGGETEPPAVRRSDDRAGSDHRGHGRRRIVKLRDLEHVTSIVVTHQIRDAFYVACHEATG